MECAALRGESAANDFRDQGNRISALERPAAPADDERFALLQKRLDSQDKLLNSLRGTVGNLKKPAATAERGTGIGVPEKDANTKPVPKTDKPVEKEGDKW